MYINQRWKYVTAPLKDINVTIPGRMNAITHSNVDGMVIWDLRLMNEWCFDLSFEPLAFAFDARGSKAKKWGSW